MFEAVGTCWEAPSEALIDAVTGLSGSGPAYVLVFPEALGDLVSPDWLVALLRLDTDAPLAPDDETRKTVRDVFRHGGYKPTGRGKPASEYLVRAAGEGKLSSINPAVNLCNVASLHRS